MKQARLIKQKDVKSLEESRNTPSKQMQSSSAGPLSGQAPGEMVKEWVQKRRAATGLNPRKQFAELFS